MPATTSAPDAAASTSNGSAGTNGAAPRPKRVFDAIVVGGGHNGLTTGRLSRQGRTHVCVLERRDILGGACVTEEVFPGARISRASYVVSMLQPQIVKDLQPPRLRLQGPAARSRLRGAHPRRPDLLLDETEKTQASIAPFSKKDAEAYAGFEDLLVKAGDFLRPMLMREPPALGSKRPGDLLSLLREGARASGLGRNDVHDLVRIFTMSVGDLLDDWFEHRRPQGLARLHRRRRRLGRPPHPGHGLQPAASRARRARRRPRRLGPGDRRHGRDLERDRPLGRGVRRGHPHRRRGRQHRRPRRRDGRRDPRRRRGAARSRSSPPARTRRRPCSTSSAADELPRRGRRRTCAGTAPAAAR